MHLYLIPIAPFSIQSFFIFSFSLLFDHRLPASARDDDDGFNKQLFYLIKYVPLIKYFSCWFRCCFFFIQHSDSQFSQSKCVCSSRLSSARVCVCVLVSVSCTKMEMDLIGAQENYAEWLAHWIWQRKKQCRWNKLPRHSFKILIRSERDIPLTTTTTLLLLQHIWSI